MKIEKNDYQGKGYVIYRQLINDTFADVFMCYLGLKRKVREELIKDKVINDQSTLFGHIGDSLLKDCYSLYGDSSSFTNINPHNISLTKSAADTGIIAK